MEPNKENLTACNQAIQRFQGLRYFRNLTAVSIQEMSDALLRSCRTPSQAVRVVDKWLSLYSDYPTPADIRALADSMDEYPGVLFDGKIHLGSWIQMSVEERETWKEYQP